MIEDDKVVHSSVGLGIKLGLLYTILINAITLIIAYFFGFKIAIIACLILIILTYWRGAWIAGYCKELIDKYRYGVFDKADISATQNSKIVLDWYKKRTI